jgi:hypothetical protein
MLVVYLNQLVGAARIIWLIWKLPIDMAVSMTVDARNEGYAKWLTANIPLSPNWITVL